MTLAPVGIAAFAPTLTMRPPRTTTTTILDGIPALRIDHPRGADDSRGSARWPACLSSSNCASRGERQQYGHETAKTLCGRVESQGLEQ